MKTVNVKYSEGTDVYNCEAFITGKYIVLIAAEELLILVYDTQNNSIKWMDIETDLDWYGGWHKCTETERINLSKLWHVILKKLTEG